MFIASFAAGPWQTNCYLVGPDGSDDVVVIDPGVGAAAQVDALCSEHGRRVAGVLLTHGHIDHVASAADVADAAGVPAWIHPTDRDLLTDAGPLLPEAARVQLGIDLREPAELRLLSDGEHVAVAGLRFDVHHAPGHRPGCVLFSTLRDADEPDAGPLVFAGDVVFAGSIGRTDLPGGDPDAMRATLRDVVLALPDEATLLPGHGPVTTMRAERASNPYLQPAFVR